MFGPKNAPATQIQYLYLPCKDNVHSDDDTVGNAMDKLKQFNPTRGAVLTITQFDGIPMADVFKVMQYWSFESTNGISDCIVRIGVSLHFIKSSLFKAQIVGGTKDELGDQVSN
jgi:hypothetical protein